MGGGSALTATSTGTIARPNKAPASAAATTAATATAYRSPSSNRVSLSSSVHSPHRDISENREDSLLDPIFLSVPSRAEVEDALASFRSFMQGIPLYDPRLTQSPGFRRVKDALHLLETDQFVQRMVLSISSDKSVWDAVLKNKLFKQLRESLGRAELIGSPDHNEDPDPVAKVLRWILDMVKAKIMELVEKFRSLVDEIFESTPQKEHITAKSREPLEEKLKSSVLLSIIILLIVVVTRASRLQ